ncbi:hypothetical protein O7A70_32490 [Mesorhizobium sp. Cs1299R1N1]|uniref:hypothetical protein n=1 Tax=Mesorhizobium sp. Cs1299R1N1 TaxID=3015172 RepID=UPI00301C261F
MRFHPAIPAIAAIVGGYEMSLRFGTAIRPSEDRDRQVKGFATWQIFGGCTAASLLHRFSVGQMAVPRCELS